MQLTVQRYEDRRLPHKDRWFRIFPITFFQNFILNENVFFFAILPPLFPITKLIQSSEFTKRKQGYEQRSITRFHTVIVTNVVPRAVISPPLIEGEPATFRNRSIRDTTSAQTCRFPDTSRTKREKKKDGGQPSSTLPLFPLFFIAAPTRRNAKRIYN